MCKLLPRQQMCKEDVHFVLLVHSQKVFLQLMFSLFEQTSMLLWNKQKQYLDSDNINFYLDVKTRFVLISNWIFMVELLHVGWTSIKQPLWEYRQVATQRRLAQSFAETPLYFERNKQRARHYWSTISCHLLHWTAFSFKLSVSSPWRLLNQGENNRRTLIGMAKRWLHHFIYFFPKLF